MNEDIMTQGSSEPPTGPGAELLRAFVGGDGRVEGLERYGTLAARILISQIFLLSGVMKIVDWSGTEAQMASRGMFWIPFFHVAALLVELGAGLSLLLGYKARLGALVLFLFLIPVTLTFHNWWTYADPKEHHMNMLFFMHNLTLMGGLILVMTFGPGPLSIDLRGRRPS
jgi:putative oxidoreductase